jgi:MoxR-like ATPase
VTHTQDIQTLRSELNTLFPERKAVIDGALASILASEHVLMLGPPGTAKSALVRSIVRAFDATWFEVLLTRFSTPEEIFGPISLKALEQDRFTRKTTGRLPTVDFGFVDEVFKASSAILNTMLAIMADRVFHDDGQVIPCPMVTLFGASNELPDGKDLEALFDRFLLRFDLQYMLRPGNLRTVLTSPDPVPKTKLSMNTLKAAQQEAMRVKLTDETVDGLIAIRDACRVEGIIASDRRWKRSLKIVQATAFLAGEKETCPEDLAVLVDTLWREPKERAKVARLVGKLADPVSTQATEILDAARETAAKVESLNTTDRKAHITQAAQALEQFKAQEKKLVDLAKSAGKRAKNVITDATVEIRGLHADLARTVSNGLGLGMRAVR